jgi:hypothetical protein
LHRRRQFVVPRLGQHRFRVFLCPFLYLDLGFLDRVRLEVRTVDWISSSLPAPTPAAQVVAVAGRLTPKRNQRRWSSPQRSSSERGKPSQKPQVEVEERAEEDTEAVLAEPGDDKLTTTMQWTLQQGTMSVDLIG